MKTQLLLAAALIACTAQAQTNPPGASVPPNTPGIATGKSDAAAEARKARRPAKPTPKTAGDVTASAESSLRAPDKAEQAGERRAATRDQRRPGHARTTQGGTPE